MELHPELPTAGGFCGAQGNVGGKILLESIWEDTTLALILVKISDCLSVSPPKLSLGVGKGPGRSALQSREACMNCPGELCSPFGYCNSAAEGEERAVQILSGLLIPFICRKLMGEWWNNGHVEAIQHQCWVISRDTELSSCCLSPGSPFGLWSP